MCSSDLDIGTGLIAPVARSKEIPAGEQHPRLIPWVVGVGLCRSNFAGCDMYRQRRAGGHTPDQGGNQMDHRTGTQGQRVLGALLSIGGFTEGLRSGGLRADKDMATPVKTWICHRHSLPHGKRNLTDALAPLGEKPPQVHRVEPFDARRQRWPQPVLPPLRWNLPTPAADHRR